MQADRYAKDFIPLLESDTSAEGSAAVGAGGAADNQSAHHRLSPEEERPRGKTEAAQGRSDVVVGRWKKS